MKTVLEPHSVTSLCFVFYILLLYVSYRARDGCLVCKAMAVLSKSKQQASDQPAKPGLGVWTLKQTACLPGAEWQTALPVKRPFVR